jgi:hypothetical protein
MVRVYRCVFAQPRKKFVVLSALCYYYFSKEKKEKIFTFSRAVFHISFSACHPQLLFNFEKSCFSFFLKKLLGGWQLERGGHNKKDMEENDQVVSVCARGRHTIYYALRVTKARVTEEVR